MCNYFFLHNFKLIYLCLYIYWYIFSIIIIIFYTEKYIDFNKEEPRKDIPILLMFMLLPIYIQY